MVYTIDEIKEKVKLVAKKYHIPKVYLFGSYARNEADDLSDVDLAVVDAEDNLYPIYLEYQEMFNENVDVLSETMLLNPKTSIGQLVKRNFLKERILIYEES